ncbi:MAG: MBL fold metallo-hydrolase [Anaerolineae bacterium]|jgi:glyoxylase-like metal-dependent hydrolase (beta-lactamase superfamily II)
MREVVSNVCMFEGLRGCNVYLLVSGEGLTLVDSGLAGDAGRIVAQLQEVGHAPSELHSIVLTHAHGDHAGGAVVLARRSGAQVLAHRDEVPYIEQTQSLPAHSAVQRLLFRLGDRMLFRLSPCQVDRPLEDGDVIAALGGTHVIHTPGHTPGSMALYQPEQRILFCGDALFNANPVTGKPGLRLPMPLVTLDTAQARDSVRKLSTLPVQVLCCGHGEPILDGAAESIEAVLGEEDPASGVDCGER